MITVLVVTAVALAIVAALIYWYAFAVAERTSRPAISEEAMKLFHPRRLLYPLGMVVTIGLAMALTAPTPSDAAEIKVLTSRAMHHVLTDLGGTFERTSGHKVTLVLAPPTEIMKRVVDGQIVDVVMSGATVDNLVKQGKIAAGDRVLLARVGIGVAVRAGAPKPDISSPEALKRTLLGAKSIVYTDPAVGGASGIHFEKVLDRLGIAKEVKAKSTKNPLAATKPSAEFVARGEAELGIQLISEIVSVPGVELLGPLPGDLQSMTAILAGILKTAPEPEAARTLLRFLTSPAAAPAIKAAGMEPGSP
ncbi:MAG TPA: substrate-binding domain-containing protein [Burkholderiales bacterium]|nr:substrate-binding domain-containing protein [Burkholderiales bacterium]